MTIKILFIPILKCEFAEFLIEYKITLLNSPLNFKCGDFFSNSIVLHRNLNLFLPRCVHSQTFSLHKAYSKTNTWHSEFALCCKNIIITNLLWVIASVFLCVFVCTHTDTHIDVYIVKFDFFFSMKSKQVFQSVKVNCFYEYFSFPTEF